MQGRFPLSRPHFKLSRGFPSHQSRALGVESLRILGEDELEPQNPLQFDRFRGERRRQVRRDEQLEAGRVEPDADLGRRGVNRPRLVRGPFGGELRLFHHLLQADQGHAILRARVRAARVAEVQQSDDGVARPDFGTHQVEFDDFPVAVADPGEDRVRVLVHAVGGLVPVRVMMVVVEQEGVCAGAGREALIVGPLLLLQVDLIIFETVQIGATFASHQFNYNEKRKPSMAAVWQT